MVQGALNFCSRCTDDDDDDDDDLVAETDGPGTCDVAKMKGIPRYVNAKICLRDKLRLNKDSHDGCFSHLCHVIIASTSHS